LVLVVLLQHLPLPAQAAAILCLAPLHPMVAAAAARTQVTRDKTAALAVEVLAQVHLLAALAILRQQLQAKGITEELALGRLAQVVAAAQMQPGKLATHQQAIKAAMAALVQHHLFLDRLSLMLEVAAVVAHWAAQPLAALVAAVLVVIPAQFPALLEQLTLAAVAVVAVALEALALLAAQASSFCPTP
jgi:hypothetical protein